MKCIYKKYIICLVSYLLSASVLLSIISTSKNNTNKFISNSILTNNSSRYLNSNLSKNKNTGIINIINNLNYVKSYTRSVIRNQNLVKLSLLGGSIGDTNINTKRYKESELGWFSKNFKWKSRYASQTKATIDNSNKNLVFENNIISEIINILKEHPYTYEKYLNFYKYKIPNIKFFTKNNNLYLKRSNISNSKFLIDKNNTGLNSIWENSEEATISAKSIVLVGENLSKLFFKKMTFNYKVITFNSITNNYQYASPTSKSISNSSVSKNLSEYRLFRTNNESIYKNNLFLYNSSLYPNFNTIDSYNNYFLDSYLSNTNYINKCSVIPNYAILRIQLRNNLELGKGDFFQFHKYRILYTLGIATTIAVSSIIIVSLLAIKANIIINSIKRAKKEIHYFDVLSQKITTLSTNVGKIDKINSTKYLLEHSKRIMTSFEEGGITYVLSHSIKNNKYISKEVKLYFLDEIEKRKKWFLSKLDKRYTQLNPGSSYYCYELNKEIYEIKLKIELYNKSPESYSMNSFWLETKNRITDLINRAKKIPLSKNNSKILNLKIRNLVEMNELIKRKETEESTKLITAEGSKRLYKIFETKINEIETHIHSYDNLLLKMNVSINNAHVNSHWLLTRYNIDELKEQAKDPILTQWDKTSFKRKIRRLEKVNDEKRRVMAEKLNTKYTARVGTDEIADRINSTRMYNELEYFMNDIEDSLCTYEILSDKVNVDDFKKLNDDKINALVNKVKLVTLTPHDMHLFDSRIKILNGMNNSMWTERNAELSGKNAISNTPELKEIKNTNVGATEVKKIDTHVDDDFDIFSNEGELLLLLDVK